MGFSIENIIDDTSSYVAPDRAFINVVSGMVQNFPWERFERFFESRPLIQASATDQVFLLRVVAMQELLCMDDESILKWLKSQMYLLSFLSPGFKPKVPTKALLDTFRSRLHDANLLEPFRLRCQNIILKQNGRATSNPEIPYYIAAFAPSPLELSDSGMTKEVSTKNTQTVHPLIEFEDKWVICPKCESSSLNKVEASENGYIPEACCKQCGHKFKV